MQRSKLNLAIVALFFIMGLGMGVPDLFRYSQNVRIVDAVGFVRGRGDSWGRYMRPRRCIRVEIQGPIWRRKAGSDLAA
jgi:hypothetical protein